MKKHVFLKEKFDRAIAFACIKNLLIYLDSACETTPESIGNI